MPKRYCFKMVKSTSGIAIFEVLLFYVVQMWCKSINQKRQQSYLLIISVLSSTQTRGRTGMEVNPLVFETSASTDSAIWAGREDGDKGRKSFGIDKNLTILFLSLTRREKNT